MTMEPNRKPEGLKRPPAPPPPPRPVHGVVRLEIAAMTPKPKNLKKPPPKKK